MKIRNTFGIDAQCRRYLEYATTEEARTIANQLRNDGGPFLIVGAGSNLLSTADYDGTVVHSAIRGITLLFSPHAWGNDNQEDEGAALLRCGSGETWDDVVAWSVDRGFADLANLSLIPGEVGASAVQNIGAYGAEACQFIHDIRAVDIQTGLPVVIRQQDCRYGYRDSLFKHEWKNRFLITHVSYRLHRSCKPNLEYGNLRAELGRQGIDGWPTPQQLRSVIIDIRRSKLPDPDVQGNAGSFFMNPVVSREKYEELVAVYPQMPHYYINKESEKIPAAWLIDQCGWKGRALGRAGVHDKQPLVLVNLGGATGQDIVALCQAIQNDVQQRFGILLKPEVNIV